MDQYKVDFHIHTHFSDGQASPTSIVKRAKELGYDMIAITDHDGVGGIREGMIAGEAVELNVIPGIEIATETEDGVALHILGYYIDIENPHLQEVLQQVEQKRNARNEKLLKVLAEMGYELTMEELRRKQLNNYIGKPVIARLLAEKGYIGDPKEAFIDGQFLESPQALQVKKEKLKTVDAIAVIREAGGIPVLAHPIQTWEAGRPGSEAFYERMEEIIAGLKRQGLKGLECYHPDQNHEQTMRFIEMAEKYHLHITRGSDFHGLDFADAEPTAE